MLLTNQAVLIMVFKKKPPWAFPPTTLNPILNTSTSSCSRQDNMTFCVFFCLCVSVLALCHACWDLISVSCFALVCFHALTLWCFLPVVFRLNDKLERRERDTAPYQTSCMMELGSTLVRAGFRTRTKCKPRLTLLLPFKLVKYMIHWVPTMFFLPLS